MDETSLSLLDRIRETDDAKSWDRLVALYAPLLKRWIVWYQVQESDADDIVQDVLTVVARDLATFEHNQRAGAFRSWLRTILVNRIREFWRSRKYQPMATGTSSIEEKLQQLQDDTSDVSQMWNREHDQYVLKKLIHVVQGQFEQRTWQAFKRQVFEGQEPQRVAGDLEMSMSGVYTAKYRVLNALRRESKGLIDEI